MYLDSFVLFKEKEPKVKREGRVKKKKEKKSKKKKKRKVKAEVLHPVQSLVTIRVCYFKRNKVIRIVFIFYLTNINTT